MLECYTVGMQLRAEDDERGVVSRRRFVGMRRRGITVRPSTTDKDEKDGFEDNKEAKEACSGGPGRLTQVTSMFTPQSRATQVLDPGPRTQDPGPRYKVPARPRCRLLQALYSTHAPNGPFNGPHRF